jgi:membrane fusion protein, multidrug efflux system
VMVVGVQNKVEVRALQAARTSGSDWVVTNGLRSGDKVIVEGGMLLRAGMPVKPQIWNPIAPQSQRSAPTSPQAKKG